MLTISIPLLAWVCFILCGILLSIAIGIKINKKGILKIDTLEDLNNFASIVDPDATLKISGAQFKAISQGVIQIKDDIRRCHGILNDLGVPLLDQKEDALVGIEVRLKYMLYESGDSNGKRKNNS